MISQRMNQKTVFGTSKGAPSWPDLGLTLQNGTGWLSGCPTQSVVIQLELEGASLSAQAVKKIGV